MNLIIWINDGPFFSNIKKLHNSNIHIVLFLNEYATVGDRFLEIPIITPEKFMRKHDQFNFDLILIFSYSDHIKKRQMLFEMGIPVEKIASQNIFRFLINSNLSDNDEILNFIILNQNISLFKTPPPFIPNELVDRFTINGSIPVKYEYRNDSSIIPLHITDSVYRDYIKRIKSYNFSYYGNEGKMLYDIFTKYDILNKNVLIIGLASCNCDAFALAFGANKVYIVDYNKPICDHKDIEVLTVDNLKNLDMKFDCIISYSSFEHSGLGRYGDELSPDADIDAVKFYAKFLDSNSIFIIAIPIGKDCLAFNAHRIYGKIRLKILFSPLELIDCFSISEQTDAENFFKYNLGEFEQLTFILTNKNYSTRLLEKKFKIKNKKINFSTNKLDFLKKFIKIIKNNNHLNFPGAL